MKKVYILLMNTKTGISKMIKKYTKYKYSHVAISLDTKFTTLHSFGRKKTYNCLNGGFISYGLGSHFFNKYKDTECIIYELELSDKKYKLLLKNLDDYIQNRDKYHYDIIGLIVRLFSGNYKQRQYYHVCSEFVARLLKDSNIIEFDKNVEYIKPEDFSRINILKPIYEGKLIDFKD